MPDPRTPQGNLNRIKATVVWSDFPNLNITPDYLGSEGLSLAFEDMATARIPTMTGLVNSPEAFQSVSVSAHLLKTQPLAQLYEEQRQNYTLLGQCTIRPDVSVNNAGSIGPYTLLNMSITNIAELRFNGSDAGFRVLLGGYMLINSALWNG
jgi:hypothetical protein